jgi:hypothetical protein
LSGWRLVDRYGGIIQTRHLIAEERHYHAVN